MRIPTPGCVRKTLALLFVTNSLLLLTGAAFVFQHARQRQMDDAVDETAACLALEAVAGAPDTRSDASGRTGMVQTINLHESAPAATSDPQPGEIRVAPAPPSPTLDRDAVWRRVEFGFRGDRGPMVASVTVALPPPHGSAREALWHFLAPLMALAAAGVLVAWWCVQRDVLKPLATLTAAVTEPEQLESVDHAIASRSDVLGQLARSITELHRDAAQARHRADYVERQVDSRISARMRAITRELLDARRALWEDPLTGVRSRRLYEERFAEIFQAQRDARAELSVIVIDVDHFKHFNDTFGHAAGDELLRFVGVLLQQSIREDDLAIRIGGDEFLIVLPGAEPGKAEALAQRLVSLFDEYTAVLEGIEPKPGLSAGVAALQRDQLNGPAALVELADRRMYECKARKRARTGAARPHPRPPVLPDAIGSTTRL